jgi:hypothetical protein
LRKKSSGLRIGKASLSAVAPTGFFGLLLTKRLLALQKKKVVYNPRPAAVIFPGFFVNPVEQVGVKSYLD